MKKKLVIALDILVIAIVAFVMFAGKSVQSIVTGMKSTHAMAANEELSFNLKASPEKARVKAGATVVVTLSAEDIKVGEEGLNNIVGKLGYDEALFESVEIYAGGPEEKETTKWELELNRIKDHKLYGKFCIFTMQEGVKENQNVATLIFKLKSDLKPQTTKVTFTELESSDGNVSIPEEDREVEITIYEDEIIPEEPKEEEPVKPEPKKEEPVKPEPVQTADSQTLFVIITLVSTIIINILVFTKTNKNKILGSILVVLVGFLSMQYAAYAADLNHKEIAEKMAYTETWLNSEKYLVTEEDVSRIAPETTIENLVNKFNKGVEVKKLNNKLTTGKVSTGMTINVENPGKTDAEGDFKYAVSVFGDINGDGSTNHVDLTSTIRNVVDSKKWSMNVLESISADIVVDYSIDRKDIDASVKHIVYGDLEIPTFEPVKAPTISIIDGKKDEDRKCYVGSVELQVQQTQGDAKVTRYKIEKDGETTNVYSDVNGRIVLIQPGTYKISAYTVGKDGNRSGIPYIIFTLEEEIIIRSYEINYFYNNIKVDSQTITESCPVGTTITEVPDKSTYNSVKYELDTTKGNGTGIETLPLKVDTDTSKNIINVYYKLDSGMLVIHHYDADSKNNEEKTDEDKIAEDEIVPIEYTKEYKVTNLLAEDNSIIVDGKNAEIERATLDSTIYTYNSVEYDEEATATENGEVTGTAHKDMKDISYYYDVKKLNVTGEVYDGNASIKVGTKEIIKTTDAARTVKTLGEVSYNKSLSFTVTPAKGYAITGVYAYKGDKLNGDYSKDDGERLSTVMAKTYKLADIQEDTHIVVRTKESDAVVKIVAIPDDAETSDADGDYVGREYPTLGEAIEVALQINNTRIGNEECKGQTVEIQIIKKDYPVVISETNKIDFDNDVTIDLNGQKIENNDTEKATISVGTDCILQIVDRSSNQTGIIENTEGTAIKAAEGSTFILGENDPIPDIESPTIKGKEYGLYKDPDATFDFYDGQIIGDSSSAVGGNLDVDDTPDLFNAVTMEDPENPNRQIEYLSVPAGVVAMIGKDNTYTTLESAFLDAKRMSTDGKQVEIDLVANVALVNENNEENGTCIIEIPEDKNITLDLNGHVVEGTNSKNDIFINKGTFEIKDSVATYADYYDDEFYTLVPVQNGGFQFNDKNELCAEGKNDVERVVSSYIELDLTDKPESEITTIKSEYYTFGDTTKKAYICACETEELSDEGIKADFGLNLELPGGKKYYLHFVYGGNYSVTGGRANGDDRIYITNLTIDNKPMLKEFYKSTGLIKSNPSSSKGISNISSETNTAKLTFNNVDCSQTAVIENSGIFESNNSKLANVNNSSKATINGGELQSGTNNEDAEMVLDGVYKRSFGGILNKSKNLEIKNCKFTYVRNGGWNAKNNGFVGGEAKGDLKLENTEVLVNRNYIQGESVPTGVFAISQNNIEVNNCILRENGFYVYGELTAKDCNAYDVDMTIYNKATIEDSTCSGCKFLGRKSGEQENIDILVKNIKGKNDTFTVYDTADCVIDSCNLTNASFSVGYSTNVDSIITLKNGNKITSTGINNYGEFNLLDGELTLVPGKLTSGKIINSGTFNIGNNSTPINTEEPKITGTFVNSDNDTKNPMYGTVNFYDGSITAPEDQMFKNTKYLNIPENTNISVSRETIEDVVYETATLGQLKPVAKILKSSITNATGINTVTPNADDNDSNYYYFGTLEHALAACPDNSSDKIVIELIDKIDIFGELVVDKNKNVEINLNGNEIYFVFEDKSLVNKGNLTITDDQIGKGIVNPIIYDNRDDYTNIIKNESTGTLELNCMVKAESFINEGTLILNGQIVDNAEKIIYNAAFNNSNKLIFNGGYTKRNIENTENATCTINGGQFASDSNANKPGSTIFVKDNSKLIINGGHVNYAITITEHENPTEPALKINGGYIGETSYYVHVTNPITNNTPAEIIIKSTDLDNKINISSEIITDGKITIEDVIGRDGSRAGISLKSSNEVTITNSEMYYAKVDSTESITATISNSSFGGGAATFSGGGVEAAGEASINMSNITIYDSTYTRASLINSGNGNIVLTNSGEFDDYTIETVELTGTGNVTLNHVNSELITNSGEGKITFNGVHTSGTVTNSGAGTIEIPCSNDNIISTGNSNSAIDNTGSGDVIIGTEDATVDTEYPSITCDKWGIRNSGTGHIYVYDGAITATINQAKSGDINCLAGYELVDKETGDANRQTLILGREYCAKIAKDDVQNTTKGALTDDGLYYQFYSLQDAIDSTKDNTQTTIEITRNINGSSAFTVGANKNIIIDLKGYGLNISTNDWCTNNGTLTIKNSESQGNINATSERLFANNKNMTLQDIVVNVTKSGTEDNKLNEISNKENSTFNMINAQIAVDGTNMRVVENRGTFNMSKLSSITRVSSSRIDGEDILINYGSATITNSNIVRGNVYNYDSAELNLIKDTTDSSLTDAQKNSDYGIFGAGLINDGTNRESGSTRAKVIIDGARVNPLNCYNYYTYKEYKLENHDGDITIKNKATIDCVCQYYGEILYDTFVNDNGSIKVEDATIIIGSINNKESSTFEFDNGTIHCGSITNDGTAKIYGGLIAGADSKFMTINNNGDLTLGKNDTSVSGEIPELRGTVVNSEDGTFNFYDGKVLNEAWPVKGTINNVPTNGSIRYEDVTQTIGEHSYNCKCYYASTDTIAKIGSTEYKSLQAAFNACPDSTATTIVLQENVVQLDKISIGSNKNVKLDLNGKTIVYLNDENMLTNAGTLELTDSSTDGNGKIITGIGGIVNNTNKLTISGGNYSFAYDNLKDQYIVNNSGNGTVSMTGGTITVDLGIQYEYAYGIKSENGKDINISGGTITANGYTDGIYVKSTDTDNKGKVIISGTAKLIGTHKKIVQNTPSKTYYYAAVFAENCDVILKENMNLESIHTANSNVNVLSGTITTIYTIDSDITIPADSTTQITELSCLGDFDSSIVGGTIDNARFEASFKIPSTVDVHDSNIRVLAIAGDATPGNDITATISNIQLQKLSIETDAIVTLGENVKLINTDNTLEAALHVIKANVTIPENIIIKSEVGPAIGYSGYCTITIGADDKIVNKNAPYIEGKTYGLEGIYHSLYRSSNLTLQFYDGTIHGEDAWTNVDIATVNTPNHYEVTTSDLHPQTSKPRTATLKFKGEYSEQAKVGDTNYTLAGAINAVNAISTHTGTITILDNIGIETGVTIKSGMNVTIDLNGKSIYGDMSTALITVESGATLTIINGNATIPSSIENTLGLAIDNKGTLNIGDNSDNEVKDNTIDIIGDQTAISNSGTISFYDGKIKAKSTSVVSGTAISGKPTGYSLKTGKESINSEEYNVVSLGK